MRYKIDHDFHIHTYLSSCSNDPTQNPSTILSYAKNNGIKTVCITDHYWDSEVDGAIPWYKRQNFDNIIKIKPLPIDSDVEFLFGCETELNRFNTLGVPASRYNDFDFIIIPTTHMHMKGFTLTEEEAQSEDDRARLWVEKLDAVLNMELPFHKVGIAHLSCRFIGVTKDEYNNVVKKIPQSELTRLFTKASSLGVGIEINTAFNEIMYPETVNIYKTAKDCGCKFYFGSDAHTPNDYEEKLQSAEKLIDLIGLDESDKFILRRDT